MSVKGLRMRAEGLGAELWHFTDFTVQKGESLWNRA